jgi:hypothetical protein
LSDVVIQKKLLRAQTHACASGDWMLSVGGACLHGEQAAVRTFPFDQRVRKQKQTSAHAPDE